MIYIDYAVRPDDTATKGAGTLHVHVASLAS